ncbi:MAG: DUF192 domain-containing protein [Steroidobacteraceae bacterium]
MSSFMRILLRPVLMGLLLALSLINVSCAADPQLKLEPLSNFPQSSLVILTPDARQHSFKVWVADTDTHREQGLMFVKSLDENTGMLFVFDQPQTIQMWMKNTLISLDMVFIDTNGRVDSVVANAKPLSLSIIDSKRTVLGVLELAGGSAAKLGIRAGAVVKHPFFASVGGSR